jgi:steroid delta-isomerase-like uncharacterized protein
MDMDAASARKALLAQFLDEVWSNGNVAACSRYLSDKYEIHHDPGDPWEGRRLTLAEFEERVSLSRAPFPDQRFDVQTMLEEGMEVAASWVWSATHSGDLPGYPATGQVIRMSGATIYYFDERDRISGHWQVTDRLGIFQQLQLGRT